MTSLGTIFARTQPAAMSSACLPSPSLSRASALAGSTRSATSSAVEGTRFINDGSAGKPKDGDPRAGWVLVETGPQGISVAFRRVAYDVEVAAAAIEASELPDEFAGQLREGRGFRPRVEV